MSAALRPAYPLQRPAKRRRTATSVLAGDFDPRPRRDCFTDMANSRNQPSSSSTSVAVFPNKQPSQLFWDLPQNRRRAVARSALHGVDPPSANMLIQVVEGLPYDPLHPNSPRLPENRPESLPDSLFLPQPASGTAPQRLHQSPFQSPRLPPSPLSSAQHAPWSPDYRSPLLPWAPSPLEISTGSQVSNSPRPSSLHPNSPPTPSRSISSYSSRTSSKRPRTPDDDELIPGSTPLHPSQSASFQLYDDGRPPTLFSDSLASPFHGPRENPSSPPKSLAWYSPPADAMQAELPAQPRDTSPFSLDRSPPAHRRHALSVAALLSPSMAARLPPPPEPSAQPLLSRHATPPPITEQEPEPEPEIMLSYPSPSEDLDMDMDVSEDLPAPVEDSAGDAENHPSPEHEHEHADLGNEPTPAPTPEPERDLLPDATGRASKAMRIIQSEDELTDLEHAAAGSPSSPYKSRAAASLAVTPAPGRVRRKRPAARKGWKGWVEVEVDDEAEEKKEVPGQRAGSVGSAAGDVMAWASLRERRTRSGRQFDA